ncbi:MAG: T9SS type A sorting domain-containing protein [Bacteroidetes bacterium]|nr:T9SS type A sorting domain-containing protein [Bacteroidota bacterium]
MNKICTYVGTTLCTIFFFVATALGQNNPPIPNYGGGGTTLHQPVIVHVNDVAIDPDGDRIFITAINDYQSGTTTLLSDTTFRYQPSITGCGNTNISITVCDTSLVYFNSMCSTFNFVFDDECSWLPVTLDSPHPDESVCNGASVVYAPAMSGGSNTYRITLFSSNLNDTFSRDPYDTFNTTTGVMKYHGSGERTITLMIEDYYSGEIATDIPYTTVTVYDYFGDDIDTDSTYLNKLYSIQNSPAPAIYNHIVTWLDGNGTALKTRTLTAQTSMGMVLEAMEVGVSMPGYYTLKVQDLATGCEHSITKYYTGMNHPVFTDPFFNNPIFIPTGGTPVIVESYLSNTYWDENDANNGRIRFINTVTNPTKGVVTYLNGDMYYTATNQCGIDSFLAIGCDTSHFLPHTTCDTIMVYVDIDCSISAQAFPVQNASCFGSSDGVASVNVEGTNGNNNGLTYLWSNGATTETASGLSAGTYTVTVTNQNVATATATVVVNQPQALQANMQAVNTCGSTCNGSIVATVFGGTAPYTYVWNNGSTAANITNLCSGFIYTATIVDANACTLIDGATINQTPSTVTISLTTVDIDCNNTTGSITATASNGVPPYTYLWDNTVSGSVLSTLAPGLHQVEVTDATGCGAVASGTILNNTGLSAAIVDSILPSCNSSTNGMVQVAPAGGVVPYTYEWAGNASTTNTATGLGVGIHSVTVSDNGGCSFVYQFGLDPQTELNLSNTSVAANCLPGQQGQVVVQVTNGTAPYNYIWSNGATGTTLLASAGIYQVTATDAIGCSVASNVSILNYSLFFSAYTVPENCSGGNGSAHVIPYNGQFPYSYEWNNNPLLNNDTLSGIAAGTYTIKVSDANGCYRTASRLVGSDCYATLHGSIFVDQNGDCIKQPNETAVQGYYAVSATRNGIIYYGSITNGIYQVTVRDTGSYVLQVHARACDVICGIQNVSVGVLANEYTIPPVGITLSTANELAVNVTVGGLNPGFYSNLFLNLSNDGHTSVNSTATLHYDPTLSFVSASDNGVVNTTAHTVTWTNVPLSSYSNVSVYARFLVPVRTPISTLITNTATVQPDSNDCKPQNNSITVIRSVTGSYDPNMKVANPSTEILETDSVIHYTIHFQNTGNDTTHFVILKDTLSALVDPASFEFGGASHQPCRYEVSGTGILTFTFDPIYLVDSATNEEASKGYVNYSIKKKASTQVGEVIQNTAHIYFDYNPAIVTNTTENEVTTLVSIRDIKASAKLNAKVYPNPFTEDAVIETSDALHNARLVISNVNGQIVQQYQGDGISKWHISKQGLAQGMYTFAIYSGGIVKIRGKLIAE